MPRPVRSQTAVWVAKITYNIDKLEFVSINDINSNKIIKKQVERLSHNIVNQVEEMVVGVASYQEERLFYGVGY